MGPGRFRAPRSISPMRLDGTVGDPYDNAMAESADGAYETELVWRRKLFADLTELELATFRWVSWWNSKRRHQSLGYRTPEQIETEYYASRLTIKGEQKSGHSNFPPPPNTTVKPRS